MINARDQVRYLARIVLEGESRRHPALLVEEQGGLTADPVADLKNKNALPAMVQDVDLMIR